MSKTKTLTHAGLIGLLVTLPFVVLELYNRDPALVAFPVALFVGMWFFSAVFFYLMFSIVRIVRQGKTKEKWSPLVLQIIIAVLIAHGWIYLVFVDQMPCFLGAMGC